MIYFTILRHKQSADWRREGKSPDDAVAFPLKAGILPY